MSLVEISKEGNEKITIAGGCVFQGSKYLGTVDELSGSRYIAKRPGQWAKLGSQVFSNQVEAATYLAEVAQ